MKKLFALLLAALMLLSLCGCQSEEAKNAQALIDAIGEVTADSDAAITAAEEAYAALSDEDKQTVENHSVLTEARTACDIAMTQRDAQLVTGMIDAIGTVTLDSEGAVKAAEEAYAALNDNGKALVANTDVLTAARETYDQLYEEAQFEAFRLSFVGEWVNEVSMHYPNALEDTNCMPREFTAVFPDGDSSTKTADGFSLEEDGTFYIRFQMGTWTLSEDVSTIMLTVENCDVGVDTMTLNIVEEDGFTKLVGTILNNQPFAYVLEEDYEAAFSAKYAAVELTDENLKDYIGDPVCFENVMNRQIGYVVDAYFFPSQAYDNGLVYLGCNYCDVDYVWQEGGQPRQSGSVFPVYWYTIASANITGVGLGSSASGTMFYVKADHVAENYVNENGYRTLVLTNGVELVFDGYGDFYDNFWPNVNASYDEYIY